MDRRLLLTAVITNYNHGHYLPIAVEAMVKQSRPADELILIDDASTDGSQEVVDELVRRYPFIRVIKHSVNRGVLRTVQEALELATSDYFYAGAADDMVLPGFFESAMSLLGKFPDAPVCAGKPVYWNEEFDRQFCGCGGMPLDRQFLKPTEVWGLARSGALGLGGSSALCRVADLKALGGFRASLKWHVDFFLVYALALSGGLAWTGQPTAVFRIHAKSYSNIRFDQPRQEREVLSVLASVVTAEMSAEVQSGFRASGILGRMSWPMARTLMAERRYRSQLSLAFWRVCLATIKVRMMAAAARAILPTKLRLAIGRRPRPKRSLICPQ
jgi:GT2 family glycosyltransferase